MTDATEEPTKLLLDLAIDFSNYKSFGPPQSIPRIANLNFIVGRNNSGKSALLEAISAAVRTTKLPESGARRPRPDTTDDTAPHLWKSLPLTQPMIQAVLGEGFWSYHHSRHLIGKRIGWLVGAGSKATFRGLEDQPTLQSALPTFLNHENLQRLASHAAAKLASESPVFMRIAAERDVLPESPEEILDGDDCPLHGDGAGVTSLFFHCDRHEKQTDSDAISLVLRDLNSILVPDYSFSRISTRIRHAKKDQPATWEIYLRDAQSSIDIPLSSCGSGVKTILIVLAATRLLPVVRSKYRLNSMVLAIEEPENNLHPATQRRFLGYLKSLEREGLVAFITTHSSSLIDLASRDPRTQVLHVRHDGQMSSVSEVSTKASSFAALDDLGTRSSDLLQANGLIWVEGPSDRIYINRWIELWSAGGLKEGTHYCCVMYGGSSVKYHNAHTDWDPSDVLIGMLAVNRNACVVIDSDASDLSTAKALQRTRISAEVASSGGLAWITKDDEIEDYVPKSIFEQLAGTPLPHRLFRTMERKIADGIGHNQRRGSAKVPIALAVVPLLARPHLEADQELAERLESLCARIRAWNGLDQ